MLVRYRVAWRRHAARLCRMFAAVLTFTVAASMLLASAEAASLRNVLMIAVDDLRPVGKAFGEPEALVPTLDKLATESVVFGNAWVQCATCGVSRSSLLTGRRPDTTKVLNNGVCPFTSDPRHKNWISLPQHFRNQGYTTAGLGKIFHPNICEGAAVGEQAAAWSLPYYHAPCISLGSIYNGSCFEDYPFKLPGGGQKVTSAFANATGEDEDLPDGMIAAHAVATLHKLAADHHTPFFLAVGFHKPVSARCPPPVCPAFVLIAQDATY